MLIQAPASCLCYPGPHLLLPKASYFMQLRTMTPCTDIFLPWPAAYVILYERVLPTSEIRAGPGAKEASTFVVTSQASISLLLHLLKATVAISVGEESAQPRMPELALCLHPRHLSQKRLTALHHHVPPAVTTLCFPHDVSASPGYFARLRSQTLVISHAAMSTLHLALCSA